MKLSNTSTTITEILWLLVCVELSTKYLFAVIAHMSNYNKLGLGMILLLPAVMGIFLIEFLTFKGLLFWKMSDRRFIFYLEEYLNI